MAKYDDTFPTRSGPSIGGAKERQMLDHLGGADGIRTHYRLNPDGSKTRVDTRLGWPHFTTEAADNTPVEFGGIYYRLVSTLNPYGVSLTKDPNNAWVPSAHWEWPVQPVSYSQLSMSNPVLIPKIFESDDGPGNMTWEDTRTTGRVFPKPITWNCCWFSRNGQHRPWLNLQRYYDANSGTLPDYPSLPVDTPDSERPGVAYPGQSDRRFVGPGMDVFNQPLKASKLYDDGVDTGISGLIVAACKHTKADLSVVYRTLEANSGAVNATPFLWLREYELDGTLASEVFINYYTTPGLQEIPMGYPAPPKFNSAGTEAAMVVGTRNTAGSLYSIMTVTINAENGALTTYPGYGYYERSQNGANPGTWMWYPDMGAVTWDIAITYAASVAAAVEYDDTDALLVLWHQYESSTHQYGTSEYFQYPSLDNGESTTLRSYIDLTTDQPTTSTLSINGSAIFAKNNPNTLIDSYFVDETFYYTTAYGLVKTAINGEGTSYRPAHGEETIGNVIGDMRKGYLVFAVSKQVHNQITATHVGSGVEHPDGSNYGLVRNNLSTYYRNGVTTEVSIVLLNIKTMVQRVLFTITPASIDEEPVSFTDTGRHGLPKIGITDPLNPDGTVPNNFTIHEDGWNEAVLKAPDCVCLESMFFAIDDKKKFIVVSGVACINLPPSPADPEIGNFIQFNKLYNTATGEIRNITMPNFGDGLVRMDEILFMNKEVTP
jgi:hypothetical protein